jgi:hypothetical protein
MGREAFRLIVPADATAMRRQRHRHYEIDFLHLFRHAASHELGHRSGERRETPVLQCVHELSSDGAIDERRPDTQQRFVVRGATR